MIHPETQITWMDLTRADRVFKGSLDDLFKEYADRVHQIGGSNMSVIAFGAENGPKIKIQEWTGWTNVQTVWKHGENIEKWIKIKVKDHPEICTIVSEYELIPAYNPDVSKVGFHGEVKYQYALKHPSRLTSDDMMRIRGIEEIYPDHPQFAPVEIEEIGSNPTYGYNIYTVSTFLNADKFHMYGSDFADVFMISGQSKGWK